MTEATDPGAVPETGAPLTGEPRDLGTPRVTDGPPTTGEVREAGSEDLAAMDQEFKRHLETLQSVESTYVLWGLSEAAEQLRNDGVPVALGAPFGALDLSLRQFGHNDVLERQEFVQGTMMAKRGLNEDERVPVLVRVYSNVEALGEEAVRGMSGKLILTPFKDPRKEGIFDEKAMGEQWAFARKYGTETTVPGLEGPQWVWESTWKDQVNRDFLKDLLFRNQIFRDRLFKAAHHLRKLSDAQVVELGKSRVLGRHVRLDWDALPG